MSEVDTNASVRKKRWMPDNNSPNCLVCNEPFTTFTNRRHHCRACYQLVCGACSSRTFLLKENDEGPLTPQRVCDDCYVELHESREVEVVGRNPYSNQPTGGVGSIDPDESVLVKIRIFEASLTELDLMNSLSGLGKSLYCRLLVSSKLIGQTKIEAPQHASLTQAHRLHIPDAQESKLAIDWGYKECFSFRVHLTCRTVDFAVIQLWKQAGSKINSDELLAHCRVPLRLWVTLNNKGRHTEPSHEKKEWRSFGTSYASGPDTDEEERQSSPGITTSVVGWHAFLRPLQRGGERKGPCMLGKVKLRVTHTWPEQARVAYHKEHWLRLPYDGPGVDRVKCCALHAGNTTLLRLFPRGSPLYHELFMPIGNGMDPFDVAPVQEKVLDAINHAQVQMQSIRCETLGRLFLTTHRLIFTPNINGSLREGKLLKIPLPWVFSTNAIPHRQGSCLATLQIHLKDGRRYFIGIREENYPEETAGSMDEEATLTVKHWEEEIKWRVEENKFHMRIRQDFSRGLHSATASPMIMSKRQSKLFSSKHRGSSTECLQEVWSFMDGKGGLSENQSMPNLQTHSSKKDEKRSTSSISLHRDKSTEINAGVLSEKLKKLAPKDNGIPSSKAQIARRSSVKSLHRRQNTPLNLLETGSGGCSTPDARSDLQSPRSGESTMPNTRTASRTERLHEQYIIDAFQADQISEFKRQGVLESNSNWHLSMVNEQYKICRSYPQVLAVPSCLSEDDIIAASKWRVNNRIPALTWLHPFTGAPLCRSSQPKLGLTNLTCPEDEKLVNAIRKSARKFIHQSGAKTKKFLPMANHAFSLRPERTLPAARPLEGSWVEVRNDNNVVTATPVGRKAESLTPKLPTRRPSINKVGISRPNFTKKSSFPTFPATDLKPKGKGPIHAVSDEPEGILSDTEDVAPGLYRRRNSNPQLPKRSGFLSFIRQSDIQDDMHIGPSCRRSHTVLRIIDARSATAAKGNTLIGGGHESVNKLGGKDNCQLQFLSIANIHSIRESFHSFISACCLEDPQESFLQNVHDSKWLHHLSSILSGAVLVAKHLEQGDPVLVHCSDGWDRTAQLCSLSQIILDPFYRTLKGFQVLIDKDWCSFGHMFDIRNGWDNLMSPIFLQFLDCLWQVMQQFPYAFEFNEDLLHILFEASHSRCFGNFLGDCEKDRIEMILQTNTQNPDEPVASFWKCIFQEEDRYKNVIYNQYRHAELMTSAIYPHVGIQSLRVWGKMYLQGVPMSQMHFGPQPCTREKELERVLFEQKVLIRRLSSHKTENEHEKEHEKSNSNNTAWFGDLFTGRFGSTESPVSPDHFYKVDGDEYSISSDSETDDVDVEDDPRTSFFHAATKPLQLLLRTRSRSDKDSFGD